VLNGQADSRPVVGDLARALGGLAAKGPSAWVGYLVDGVPGDYLVGEEHGGAPCGTVYLEGRRAVTREGSASAPRSIAILLRLGGGAVQKIRVTAADCDLDAGGLAVHWLTGVDPADSVATLSRYVKTADGTKPAQVPSWNSAMAAVALHAVPAATRALERFVAGGQPTTVRKRAAFWLGSSRGASGFLTLRGYADADPDDAFRRELPFALSVSEEPEAVEVLIKMARHDLNSEVRRQAIFWLGQKAGAKVAGTLAEAAASDPETAIKERAVFALSRLPNGEGIPTLIEVARTHADMAVRKRAVFWLGQSNDPRALDFIVSVLAGKR
jgi:HEAT repeat protein